MLHWETKEAEVSREANYQQLSEHLLSTKSGSHWKGIGTVRRAGVNLPLASLRSSRSTGVGDMGDIPLLVDWCQAIGASLLQLLPLADMGQGSCPYSAISAFAIDPIYISLDDPLFLEIDDQTCADALGALRDDLNQTARINYQVVRNRKLDLLRKIWAATADETADELSFREQSPWLDHYVEFKVLKEQHQQRCWEEWPQEDRKPGGPGTSALEQELGFQRWLQFLLDRQLSSALKYANSKGVFIVGDIPILVARDSADVWSQPELFRLDTSAGAPPDMYAEDGQNWGTPTYNWDMHREQGFDWWRARLDQASRYYNLYRIDHVVGFFRIWTIAHGETSGKNGWYVPPEEWRWGDHGREILEMMLEAAPLLPVAEDLGTIPGVCRHSLWELGICGMKVQRWEKRWHSDQQFIPLDHYPPLSLATLSTHDSEPLGQWWEVYPDQARELWGLMGQPGECPNAMNQDTYAAVLAWFSGADSIFNIYMLQELLGAIGQLPGNPADHRINIPGTVSDFNWSWRSPVKLEDLIKDVSACDKLAGLIKP
jgi:4-alpha-glucanotransferase